MQKLQRVSLGLPKLFNFDLSKIVEDKVRKLNFQETIMKKKTKERVNKEQLKSLRETNEVEEPTINIVNVIEPREAI